MSVDRAIEAMLAESERRHAWIYAAGEQIRRWREEEQRESVLTNKRADVKEANDGRG